MGNSSYKQPKRPKNILVIGRGGRENSLAWALKRSSDVEQVWVSPGNGGTELMKGCIRLNVEENDTIKIIEVCKKFKIDLIVIGPEGPLASGVAEKLRTSGCIVFGPCSKGSQLESSKSWAKELMRQYKIPTANYWEVSNKQEALNKLNDLQIPLVVKADGLAAGKGVIVSNTVEETKSAINEIFSGRLGQAANHVLLEEKIEGPEVSVFALCDGKQLVVLPPAQDHKRVGEGDTGPNTGGMGAYAPARLLDQKELKLVIQNILEPTLTGIRQKGIDYRGVIYAGLMLTKAGPKVIEFNCRFGDPECQALMPLMDTNFAQIIYACASGSLQDAPELITSEKSSACVVAAAYGYPEKTRTDDLVTIKINHQESMQIFHSGTTRNDKGELRTSGGRVLSVVAQADDFDEAFSKVYSGLEEVRFPGMHYRRDIGYQIRKI